jgi:gamma-glutamylcyclotransferase (GGCT)/AIG2-like uncharacterized protein YtfP
MSVRLFVYGTLLPHQPQWSLLSRYVTDEGWEAEVPGVLYDTGLGYPVADLNGPFDSHCLIYGKCFQLLETSVRIALEALDRYEEVHLGLYQRIEVTKKDGQTSWSYSLGPAASHHFTRLEPVPSGDWILHLAAIGDQEQPERE